MIVDMYYTDVFFHAGEVVYMLDYDTSCDDDVTIVFV